MSIWFCLSAGVLVLGCVGAVLLQRNTTHRTGRSSAQILTPFRVVAAAIAIAIYILTLPTVTGTGDNPMSVSNRIFGALYITFQVFVANLNIGDILNTFRTATDVCTRVQAAYTIVLVAIAPLIAIGFVLTFLQTFAAHIRYLIHPFREVNIFSELNERSIALARSIHEENHRHKPKTADLIIFTEVILANNEPSMELIGQARELGALCFKHDISSLPLRLHSTRARIRFFLMGDDDERNLEDAVHIINDTSLRRGPFRRFCSRLYGRVFRRDEDDDKGNEQKNTDLYLFSSTVESELALQYRPGGVHVRRIDFTREMVYDWLWRTPIDDKGKVRPAGRDLFDNAIKHEDGSKTISAVILGLGGYGTQMLKALSWYCQMDDKDGSYRLTVNAYDKDGAAEGRFRDDCPELAQCPHTDIALGPPRQDAWYDITVHSNVDVTSHAFYEKLDKLSAITFVFVALGDDSLNLAVAAKLRTWLARKEQRRYWEGTQPQILVVSCHSNEVQTAVQDSVNKMRKDKDGHHHARMDLIGDVEEMYRYDTVVRALMEDNGLVSHMQWASLVGTAWDHWEASFWNNAYNYNSSMATPIHWRARRMLGIPGADPRKRTKDDQELLSRLEHARWDAFVRGEGFIFEDADSKETDITKTHKDLVLFSRSSTDPNQPYLKDSEQAKDRNDAPDALVSIAKKLAYSYLGKEIVTKETEDASITTDEAIDAELAKHPEIPFGGDPVDSAAKVATYVLTNMKKRPKPDDNSKVPDDNDLRHVATFVEKSAKSVRENLESTPVPVLE